MDVTSFLKIGKSEASARRFLAATCWGKEKKSCPRCGAQPVYALSDHRLRCGACGYTFHDFSRRFLNNCGLTAQQWVWCIRLFCLDTQPAVMARQLDITPNTAARAIKTIRAAIMAHSLDAPLIFERGLGSSLGTARTRRRRSGPGGGPQVLPVLGVVETGGMVFVDLIPDLAPESVAHFCANFGLKAARVGDVIYTDRYQHYQTLMVCDKALRQVPLLRRNDRKLAIDATHGFWPYAKEQLKQRRGIACRYFLLYIKELEFRFNNRAHDIFHDVARCLCALVPKLK
ncbi:MAG: transposase [Desulfovibrionaceae bacterium]